MRDQLRVEDAPAQERAGRDLAPTPGKRGLCPASAWDGASEGPPVQPLAQQPGLSPSSNSVNLSFSPMQPRGTLNKSTRKTQQVFGRFVGTGKQAATERGQLPVLCHLLEGGGYCHHLAAGGGPGGVAGEAPWAMPRCGAAAEVGKRQRSPWRQAGLGTLLGLLFFVTSALEGHLLCKGHLRLNNDKEKQARALLRLWSFS